jgi:secondary thiamine-phosphate synthase enzyme
MQKLSVKSSRKNELIDITQQIKKLVENSGIKSGICVVFNPHTTAGLTINEAFDPSVKDDFVFSFNKISPDYGEFRHSEGNSDAHVKASLIGSSLNLIVEEGNIKLGQWQGIYFAEFDGPRSREVWVKIISE